MRHNAKWEPIPQEGDTRDLRQALGCFATGVTVVTTCDPTGQPLGLTVNSFSSVSLEPALVLWSLVNGSPSRGLFESATHFAINILSAEQMELCQRFSRPSEDKFAGLEWQRGLAGMPLLAGCVAQFECRREEVIDGGDHRIFLGRVESYRWSKSDPLVFCQGQLTPWQARLQEVS